MSKVSIIMATYQGERYLAEQLESILSEGNQDWDLLICDDGSTDDTLRIALEYERRYPDKIRLHRNARNLGPVMNFFNGFKMIQKENPDYIMFSDQDDVWLSHKIDIMVKRMKKMEDKYGVHCPLLTFSDAQVTDAYLNMLYASYHKSQGLDVLKKDLSHLLMENKCSGCMMMVNAALVKKVKELPEHARYHDWWLALVAASFGQISYIKIPLIYYRQHGNNVVGNQGRLSYIINRIRNLKGQRDTLLANQRQAREFLTMYHHELTERNRKILREFSNLQNESWIRRRVVLFRFGFFKSTLLRNLGVLLFI